MALSLSHPGGGDLTFNLVELRERVNELERNKDKVIKYLNSIITKLEDHYEEDHYEKAQNIHKEFKSYDDETKTHLKDDDKKAQDEEAKIKLKFEFKDEVKAFNKALRYTKKTLAASVSSR
jgi:hypothetical protein